MFKATQENLQGLKIKNYTFIKIIGEGNYGRVYEVFNEQTNQLVAAKVVPKEIFKRTPKLMELVKTQIKVLKECKNNNVVRYVDNFMSDKSLIIVMELCDGGELQEYLTKKGRLTQNQATTFLKQIINGFKGLHEVEAMHRDFKAANVLLHQNDCKIADLGFAKQVKEEALTSTFLGTSLTMAPEVLQSKKYGRKADIWSVGVVFYQLIYGDYPFKGVTDDDIINKIKATRPNYSKVNISVKAKDFIERCLTVDPKLRISWKEVYSHPLIFQEQEIKYGLGSSIKLSQNQVFYAQESSQNEVIAQKGGCEILEEKVMDTDINMQKLREQSEQRNKFETAVKQYQTQYLNRRNNIIFIFKYIVPCIISMFNKIHANHNITLFIMCKKAYHDIKLFSSHLRSKYNYLDLKNYFKEFIISKQYKDIVQLIENDCSLIRLQTEQYCAILPNSLNEETKRELDLQKIAHHSWLSFVMDTVSCYENELVGDLDSVPQAFKENVIKLIEGLYYYRTHGEDTQIEQFDKYIEGLSYEEAELRLRERWLKNLSEYQ